ncbi:SPFH domain-containing protein [Actinomycetota bacterium]
MDIPLTASEGVVDEAAAAGPWAALIVIALLLLLYVGTEIIHLLGPGERGVVYRWGRPVRVAGPGATLTLPWAERVERLPISVANHHVPLDAVTTRDGVRVGLEVTAEVEVVDPRRAVSTEIVDTEVAAITRRVVAGHVAGVSLEDLSGLQHQPIEELRRRINDETEDIGVLTRGVQVESIALPHVSDIVRWADERLASTPPGRTPGR